MRNYSVQSIISTTERMENFWRNAHGWTTPKTAALLASARLDRQTSFTRTLADYLDPFNPEEAEARQILGYATLRSLCEGLLKLFFCIYLTDFNKASGMVREKVGRVEPPEDVRFHDLITFFVDNVERIHEAFLRRVQSRGNAIHHFKERDIGTQDELIADIHTYGEFLENINGVVPYP